jgi:hypothetical protein
MASKTIDAHDARIHFGRLLDEVGRKDYTYFVKRRGKLTAVIMNPEDYLDILEINDELKDGEINKALIHSEKEFELGEIGSEEDIFNILKEEENG